MLQSENHTFGEPESGSSDTESLLKERGMTSLDIENPPPEFKDDLDGIIYNPTIGQLFTPETREIDKIKAWRTLSPERRCAYLACINIVKQRVSIVYGLAALLNMSR